MKRLKKTPKISPLPWTLRWQTTAKGVHTRFEIMDAKGRIVCKPRKQADAEMLMRAAQVWELFRELTSKVRFQHLQIQSALEINIKPDDVITEAEALLRRVTGERFW